MKELVFNRKIEKKLIEWNGEERCVPLIVIGFKQVGKSYTVNKFACENFKNVITYDFRYNKELRKIFNGSLLVDDIVSKSIPYFPEKDFDPVTTILVFEEIGDCPLARTSLKSFALDGRYKVIATGSLLGVLNYRRRQKAEIPTGYERIIEMTSLDFEEFLWAMGLNDKAIKEIKEYSKNEKEVPEAISSYYKEMVKRYMVIGGMPEAIKSYLMSNNVLNSREYLLGLIKDYRNDFGRFINEDNEEEIDYRLQAKLNRVLDSIPSQLSRETESMKFKYSDVKKGARASEFEDCFEWLEKTGLVVKCTNVKAIEKPLEANSDMDCFKAFIADTGLLMAMYPLSTTLNFIKDELDSRKGALFENLLSTMIHKAGFPLYYYSNLRDHLEIDFLLESEKGIILIEEKSVNGKMAASRAVMEGRTKYKAIKCYKVIRENFGEGSFYTSIPLYCAPFVLNDIREQLENGLILPPISYPYENE